jgi:hypothetical protein
MISDCRDAAQGPTSGPFESLGVERSGQIVVG